jgi:hypothetical protein
MTTNTHHMIGVAEVLTVEESAADVYPDNPPVAIEKRRPARVMCRYRRSGVTEDERSLRAFDHHRLSGPTFRSLTRVKGKPNGPSPCSWTTHTASTLMPCGGSNG